jgi:ribosomal protein L30
VLDICGGRVGLGNNSQVTDVRVWLSMFAIKLESNSMLVAQVHFTSSTRTSTASHAMLRSTLSKAIATSSRSFATATISPSVPSQQPTHYLITLLRSAIGLPPRSKQTLEALGLSKLHTSVLHPFSSTCAGQILTVKELVEVKNVTAEEGEEVMRRLRNRGEDKGWTVSGKAFGAGGGQSAQR